MPHHPGMIIRYRPGGRRRAPARPVPFGPLLTTPLAVLIVLGSPVEAIGDMAAPADTPSWSVTSGAGSGDPDFSLDETSTHDLTY